MHCSLGIVVMQRRALLKIPLTDHDEFMYDSSPEFSPVNSPLPPCSNVTNCIIISTQVFRLRKEAVFTYFVQGTRAVFWAKKDLGIAPDRRNSCFEKKRCIFRSLLNEWVSNAVSLKILHFNILNPLINLNNFGN